MSTNNATAMTRRFSRTAAGDISTLEALDGAVVVTAATLLDLLRRDPFDLPNLHLHVPLPTMVNEGGFNLEPNR